MPHHEKISVTGKVTDVFAHRFVVETREKRILADLTPKGAEKVQLRIGDDVSLHGEMKPSELKVERITLGETTTVIGDGESLRDADPAPALKTAIDEGYEIIGTARRKPKHYEILGRRGDGTLHEVHIELDGRLRKVKPADGEKWRSERAAAQAPTV